VSQTVAEVHRKSALASTVDPVLLAASHVHFDQLSGQATVEKALFDALTSPQPARWELCGPDGAGKSSTFARLIQDVTRLKGSSYEVLMLDVGDPEVLKSELAFCRHVIGTIASQSHRFASPIQEQIKLAGADQTTVNLPKQTHASSIRADAGVVSASYGYNLTERFETLSWGTQPARAKNDVRAIVGDLQRAGRRLVVVLDDTEKFALTSDGEIDEEALGGLARHAIPLLADLDVDLLVATHPRFSSSPALQLASEKWLKHTEIPPLSMEGRHAFPLGEIIDKHLRARGVQASWREVFEESVIYQLQSIYFVWDRNLRRVLDLAHEAAGHAHLETKTKLVGPRHVYAAQAHA
jgi:hypothetical protein